MTDKTRMKLFFLVLILFNLAANFAHPVTPTVIKSLNLGDYMFGVALASMMTSNFLMSPFWGKINGFTSSKMSMLIGSMGYAIGQFMFGMATNEIGIIVARAFAGIFTGGTFVSFLTYVINVSPEEDRGKNLTISATIGSVASAFGYLIGGFLGEVSVFLTFAAQSLTLAVAGILFFFICKNDATASIKEISVKRLVKEANPFAAFVAGKKYLTITFILLFFMVALQNLGMTAYDQCFNYFIKDQFGFTSSYNGMIKAVVGLISLIANCTICMWLIQKTNVKKSIIFVLSFCSIATLAVAYIQDIVPFMIVNIIFFAFNAVSIPILQNMAASKAKGGDSNLVMGMYNSIKSLGGIIGSLTAGFLYAQGARLSFVFSFLAFLLAAILATAHYKIKDENNTKV